ncbi:MAG: hypothetical protein U0521_22520 [Anaerolineae bacterium]
MGCATTDTATHIRSADHDEDENAYGEEAPIELPPTTLPVRLRRVPDDSCVLACIERPTFFYGQVLNDKDLNAVVDYTRKRPGAAPPA